MLQLVNYRMEILCPLRIIWVVREQTRIYRATDQY